MSFTVAGKPVGAIGFGMGGLTHPRGGTPPATEDAIAVLKAALEAGANLWNAGTIYGTNEYNSLHLLNAYFTKYPEDAPKVVISVKAGLDMATGIQRCDAEGVRSEIEHCLAVLDGKCQIDIWQTGRLDPKIPVEVTVGAIAEAVKVGKIRGVGLSEVGASSIRKAAAVHPLAAVEIELGLFETSNLTNGVAQTCAELKIPIVSYSPLGRGFLTGQLRKYEDMPEHDYRRMMPRFQPDVFNQNLKLVTEIEHVAKAKGCTPAQVAIAWVVAQTENVGTPVIPIPGAIAISRMQENTQHIELSSSEVKELTEMLKRIEIKGGRAPAKFSHLLAL